MKELENRILYGRIILLFSMLLALPIVGASMFVGKLIETNKYLNVVFFGRLFK